MIQYAKTKYGTLESVKSNAGFACFQACYAISVGNHSWFALPKSLTPGKV